MSISMGGDDSVDYSDFEFEQVSHQLRVDQSAYGGTNIGVGVVDDVEVLGAQAGLSNDEVAEVVYHELTATLEFDDEIGDQDVGTFSEARGAFGVDLSGQNLINNTVPVRNEDGDDVVIGNSGNGDATGPGTDSKIFQTSQPEVFQMWRTMGAPPGDDETGGPGTGAFTDQFQRERNWRDLVGRGPVLDSKDNLSFATKVIVGDTVIDPTVNVDVHLVYDIAEMEEGGARFSVP